MILPYRSVPLLGLLAAACATTGGLLEPAAPARPDGSALVSPALESEQPEHGYLATVGRDLRRAPARLWQDGEVIFTDSDNLLLLAGSGLVAMGIEQLEDFERKEDEYFVKKQVYNQTIYNALDQYGSGELLFLGSFAWYLGARALELEHGTQASQDALSTLVLSTVASSLLKVVIQDERPDGGNYGLPSGHSSITMAFATTMGESYGPAVGVPLGLLSILVGIQRLDGRRHDFDDLLTGWTLGWIVGHGVAEARRERAAAEGGLQPFFDPQHGAVGLSYQWSF